MRPYQGQHILMADGPKASRNNVWMVWHCLYTARGNTQLVRKRSQKPDWLALGLGQAKGKRRQILNKQELTPKKHLVVYCGALEIGRVSRLNTKVLLCVALCIWEPFQRRETGIR